MVQVVSLAERPTLLLASVLLFSICAQASGEEVVVDFEKVPIRLDPIDDEKINRLETYEEKGVQFKLARQPEKSRARGRIMFFPHISTGRKGILNAMANEQEIPVQARFPEDVDSVTIRFWASTGTSALLEAFDDNDQRVAQDELLVVPGRTKPEDPIPMFELTVKANRIAYVEFSGPRTGEYLVADEVRFTTAATPITIVVDAESEAGE